MFTQDTFAPVATRSTNVPGLWIYRTDDTLAAVTTAGYFQEKAFQLDPDDLIMVSCDDGQFLLGYDGPLNPLIQLAPAVAPTNVVDLTTNQTVAGEKTFTDSLTAESGGGSGLTASTQADNLVVDSGDTNGGMSLLCPSGGNANFYIGEAGNSVSAATFQFIGSVNELRLTVGGSTMGRISNARTRLDGNLTVGPGPLAVGVSNAVGVVNGVAPATQPADMFHMYSLDQVAGNAAPHFMTENGDVIRLFADGGWTAPTGTASKAGYATGTATTTQLAETLKAVVDALVANGLLK